MKQVGRILCLVITAVCVSVYSFAVNPSTASASLIEKIDGIPYYNGDTNYPIWDGGANAFSVADLSSAVVVQETDSVCNVAFIGFLVTFQRSAKEPYTPPLVGESETRYFRVNKQTGDIYVKNGPSRWYRVSAPVSKAALQHIQQAAYDHS